MDGAGGIGIGRASPLEQQQNTTIACTHWAKACVVGDARLLIGVDQFEAEYSAIELDRACGALDVKRSLEDAVDCGPCGKWLGHRDTPVNSINFDDALDARRSDWT